MNENSENDDKRPKNPHIRAIFDKIESINKNLYSENQNQESFNEIKKDFAKAAASLAIYVYRPSGFIGDDYRKLQEQYQSFSNEIQRNELYQNELNQPDMDNGPLEKQLFKNYLLQYKGNLDKLANKKQEQDSKFSSENSPANNNRNWPPRPEDDFDPNKRR